MGMLDLSQLHQDQSKDMVQVEAFLEDLLLLVLLGLAPLVATVQSR